MHRNTGSRQSNLGVVRQRQPPFSERREEALRCVSSDREDSDLPRRTEKQNASDVDVADHNTYMWIRLDAVDAIWNNHGSLPQGWKPSSPRKRGRNESSVPGASFDWVRAVVAQSSSSSPRPSSYRSKTTTSQTVLSTLRVIDDEFAPPHLRNATVSLSYDPEDLVDPVVCSANSWWNSRDKCPPEDLTSLTHLHEPSVVYCLKERYRKDSIYTYTGKILLALNPFRSIEGCYGEAIMNKYWQSNQLQRPPPHVYAIAQDAYRSMLHSMGGNNADQSILVSGESGSGKTITTKIIMGYLAAQSQRTSGRNINDLHRQGVESQILQSNPILESFGNARTVRNDNSSRFGKFMELIFASSGTLASASIETYLLEKVRIISQAPGERNYHIFYEILAGLPQIERQALRIGNVSARDFRMTASSGTFDRRDGVDDRETYQHLRKALDTVGFTEDEQRDMIKVACALLHTSNIEFAARCTTGGEEGGQLVQSMALQSALDLLGVSFEALASSLCVCVIEARGEVFHKNLTVSQSIKACEALIKATYGALFTYIVKKINLSIATHLTGDHEVQRYSRIGVLDIFGFESFAINSFEQLCINYCNEALQQQFNRFVFKLEQEEYDREGIDWAFISFPDNQDVLDLIEKRREGILSILDDQCRVATCTDASFCRAVHDICKDHPRFVASMAQRSSLSFTVHHYAGPVTYDSRFFLEKNKDELPKETTELLAASSFLFISHLGDLLSGKADAESSQRPPSPSSSVSTYSAVRAGVPPIGKKQFARGSSSLLRDSVGSQFSHQLKELRRRIDATTPHYVRCLKPNDELVPDRFEPLVIADQLRCAGVLEAIRVSRVGFPHRYCHQSFIERYGILSSSRGRAFGTTPCSAIVKDLIPMVTAALQEQRDASYSVNYQELVSVGMQMGHSKVFLRRQVFEALEYLRNRTLGKSVIVLQKHIRRFVAQIHYFEAYSSAVVLQSFARMTISKRNVSFIREDTSVVKLQCEYRRFKAKKNLVSARTVAQFCQAYQRGTIARKLYAILRADKLAMVIQRCWKRHKCQSRYKRMCVAVVVLQGFHRQRQARTLYKHLRLEARDLTAVLAERDRFKLEMMKLKKEVELMKQTSTPSDFVSKPAYTLPAPDAHSVGGSEVEHLRAEVARLQEALAKQNQVLKSGANDHPPESVFVRKMGSWSFFGAKKDDAASHNSSLGNGQSPHAVARRSPPSSEKNGWSCESPNHKVECQAVVTPLSWPSPFNPAVSSSSMSLLDAEQYSEGEDYHLQSSADARNPQGPNVYAASTSPLARSIFEEDPHPVVERRGLEFTQELRWFHQSIIDNDHRRTIATLKGAKEPHVLVNEIGDNGHAALHIAVEASNYKCAKMLIDHGAFVNTQDMAGDTALHLSTSLEMTTLLLEDGKANPNIPNMQGICALHSAVRRMDVDSVRVLLKHHAKVDTADNLRWLTPLHLAVLPGSGSEPSFLKARSEIVELLCSVDAHDVNYQDSEGNTALHYAVQIESHEAGIVTHTLLEKGANPRITNSRNQGPLLLLCHNGALRRQDIFQNCLQTMLLHGANPNDQSKRGATPLHLCLYNKDIDGAVQLVSRGAELNLFWQKPPQMASFWNDMGESEVLALDMVKDDQSLHRIIVAIAKQPRLVRPRPWCMNCKIGLRSAQEASHCGHCGRHTCASCCRSTLTTDYFPKSFATYKPTAVCLICEKILVFRKEDSSSSTHPLSSSFGDEDDKLTWD